MRELGEDDGMLERVTVPLPKVRFSLALPIAAWLIVIETPGTTLAIVAPAGMP